MKDVIELAKQAGFHFWDAGFADKGILHTTGDKFSQKCFERFATLVGNAALEQARQAAEDCDVVEAKGNTYYAQLGDAAATQRSIVAAIESLKEPTP